MNVSLAGRRIVVTGADGHFGSKVVPRLMLAGAVAIPVPRRSMDVRSSRSVHSALLQTEPFDGLVHCVARGAGPGRVDQLGLEDQLDVFETNLCGTFTVLRACCGAWAERGVRASAVVLGGGGVGGPPRPDLAAYRASKAAVTDLVENLAAAFGPAIRINTLAPGFMPSKLNPDPTRLDHTQVAVKCCTWLLSDAADTVSGRLISAARDPWESGQVAEECSYDPDTYTLRRVTQAD